MTILNDKTYKKIFSKLKKQKGLDFLKLSTELKKKSVQKMTSKERYDHINKMGLALPFIIVRSTPPSLLKQWLDMDDDFILNSI